jgi:hypothetical protein
MPDSVDDRIRQGDQQVLRLDGNAADQRIQQT